MIQQPKEACRRLYLLIVLLHCRTSLPILGVPFMVLPAHTKPRFPAPFLQTLPELVTPLKGHSLSPRSCPPTVPKVLLLLLFDLGVGGSFLFVCCWWWWFFVVVAVVVVVFSTSLSLAGNSGRLTWVRHSSRKSSATHSYQCV